MIGSPGWFTEIYPKHGSAFSIKVKSKLEEVQSPFQKIEMFDTEWFGKLMIIDGCTMVSDRDNYLYHEMMTHPVLYTHPNPKRVWVIGGGDCGSLKEVLRHPGVEEAIQIEIDEQVTRLAEKYFPDLCASNNDPRAQLLFIDGIQWVKDAPDGCVDVIIVDSTDPVGPAGPTGSVLSTMMTSTHPSGASFTHWIPSIKRSCARGSLLEAQRSGKYFSASLVTCSSISICIASSTPGWRKTSLRLPQSPPPITQTRLGFGCVYRTGCVIISW